MGLNVPNTVGDHQCIGTTPAGAGAAGHGATSTTIRKLSVTQRAVGTACSMTHDANLGTYVTINEPGMYEASVTDTASSVRSFGISKNTTQPTIAILTITAADRMGFATAPGTGVSVTLTRVIRCAAGDVLRMHDEGAAVDGVGANVLFQVTKVGPA